MWVKIASSRATYAIDEVAVGALPGGLAGVISDNLERFRTRDFTSPGIVNPVVVVIVHVVAS